MIKGISVDGGILIRVDGKNTLVSFTTYNRIQKVKKIIKKISS